MPSIREGLTAGGQPMHDSTDFNAELAARIEAAGERDNRSLEQRLEAHHEDVVLQLHNPRGSLDRMAHPEAYGDAGTSIVQAGLTYGSQAAEPDYSDPEARAQLYAEVDADPEIQAIRAKADADARELTELRQERRDNALIEQLWDAEPDEEIALWMQMSPAGRQRMTEQLGEDYAEELTDAVTQIDLAVRHRRLSAQLAAAEAENTTAFEADLGALRRLYGDPAIDTALEQAAAIGLDVLDLAKLNPSEAIGRLAAAAEAVRAAERNLVRDRFAAQILGPRSDFSSGFEVNGVRAGDRRLAEYFREVDERGLNVVDIQAAIDRARELVSTGRKGRSADDIRAGILAAERTSISDEFARVRALAQRGRDKQLEGERAAVGR